jgi:hypothetical protein
MKMSFGQAHKAAGQLHAIVGQVHAPVGRLGWFSYGGAARVVLAMVLVAVAAGVAGAGFRLRVAVWLPSPGRTARTVLLATWGTAIVAYLVCLGTYAHLLIQQHLIHSRPRLPIFPITAACMIALFFGILYMGRSLSQEARLGSALIGAIAAPVIFEFPFDLIIMTRIYPAAPDPALYWALVFAAFLLELTTLALLSLSPLVRLSRAAFFAFALMLLIFAVWALFGFGYPSAPLPFAFNAVSKVVAFVVVLSLFLPQRGQARISEPTSAAVLGQDLS